MKRRLAALGLLACTLAAPAADACGGLFCDNAAPINQSAERILFGVLDGQVHMHVRISYAGPPSKFGWLLPVPRGVQVDLSSEALFTQLDARYTPRFVLQRVEVGECPDDGEFSDGGMAASGDGGAGGDPGVTVVSREALGPYDRAILQADDVQVLRRWLDDNGYQIPAATDEKLAPYVNDATEFVAIKLLEGKEAGDIAPVHLAFPGDRPAIPIVPTAVAATPDMGILVHVVGAARAIPLNYKHVQINDLAIDWLSGGTNYPDVVSQAVDEAGGRAFTTDFAGAGGWPVPQPIDVSALREIRELGALVDYFRGQFSLDADLSRVVLGVNLGPDQWSLSELVTCNECYDYYDDFDCCPEYDRTVAVDGAAIAQQIEAEINPAREHLTALAAAQPYLTRLYSTMSASEMTEDPVFSFNDTLPAVSNVRTATLETRCDDFSGNGTLITADGLRVALVEGVNPEIVRRQDGATVRRGESPAAAIIERLPEAGAAVLERDNRPGLADTFSGTPSTDDGSCGCRVGAGAGGAGGALAFAGLVALGAVRRRRGRQSP